MNRIIGYYRREGQTDPKNQYERDHNRQQLGNPVTGDPDPANQSAENINQVNCQKRNDQRHKKVPANA
jgi:hypothetical protein